MGRIRQGYQKNNYVGSFFQWFCQVTAKAFWDWRDICWTRLWKAWQLFGRSSWQLLSFWFLCLLFFVTTFSKLFMLKQFRWHLKSSTCTSWSTTNGGATTVGRWRKAWGLDFGGPKSNGPTMWATARFSSGWWTNAMVIPAWHLRWLTPWPQPFWMGFSERTCFFLQSVSVGFFFVVSDCQGSFQQTKGLQPRFGCYLASKTSEIHSRDDSNVAGPCGAGYPATTGIYEGRRVRGFGPSSGHKAKTVWLFVWCILKEHVYVFVGFTLLFRKCYWCSRNISWTLEEALLSAEYGVAVANLSHDYREAVSYNLRKNKARFFQRPHQIHSNKQALKLEFPERWNRTDMCSKRLGFISCSGFIFEPSNNPLTLNTIMLCV